VLWAELRESDDPVVQGRARERLTEIYLPLARGLAMRYRDSREPLDDLIQVANLGLLAAIDRFDIERGIPFAAFATPTILGELKRYFRDRVWTVRVPRGLHDRLAEVEKSMARLTRENQRSPSVREVAEDLGIDEVDVLEALEANHNRRPLSLDQPTGSDEEAAPLSEWIGDEDETFELVDDRLTVGTALPDLTDDEKTMLRLRFVEDMTQSSIAEQMDCSQMHVSRVLRRSLAKIRRRIDPDQAP